MADPTTPTLAHVVLAVVLQVRDGRLQALLWQRAREPVRGRVGAPRRHARAATRRSRSRSAATWPRRSTCASVAHLEQLGRWSEPGRNPSGRELATAYLGLVPAGVDPPAPRGHRVAPRRRAAGARVRPRRDRRSPAGSGCAAKLSYTNVGFALAPADVHALGAARPLRRRARPRGLGDEPEARAPAPRRARGDGRAARAGPRGRPPGRGLPLPHAHARDHRPVRRAPTAWIAIPDSGDGRTPEPVGSTGETVYGVGEAAGRPPEADAPPTRNRPRPGLRHPRVRAGGRRQLHLPGRVGQRALHGASRAQRQLVRLGRRAEADHGARRQLRRLPLDAGKRLARPPACSPRAASRGRR